MSKAFTSGDVETPEVIRALPSGRRPLTALGLERGRADMRRLLEERDALEATGFRNDDNKRQLHEANARRIAYLERRLALSDVAPRPTPPIARAALGVRVTVRDEESEATLAYTLVGPDEVDARCGRVSPHSPVGQALWGRAIGERTFIKRPKGILEVVIEGLAEDESLSAADAPASGQE